MCAILITRMRSPMETHHGNHLLVYQYPKASPIFDPGKYLSLCDFRGFMRRFWLVSPCIGVYICTLIHLVEGLSPFLLASRSSTTRTYLGSFQPTSSDGKLPRGTLTPACTLDDLRTVQQQGGVVEDVSYDGESFLITLVDWLYSVSYILKAPRHLDTRTMCASYLKQRI